MSDSKTKVFNVQEAVHELQKAVEDIHTRLASLQGAIATINKRIAPIAPTIDDGGEYGAVVKASDLLGTDEGQE